MSSSAYRVIVVCTGNICRSPMGEFILREKFEEAGLGERARLAIARALLSGRPVLLLDEPVAHLDHPTAEAVLADLFRSAAGRTVVLVSHRPEGLNGAGRIMDLGAATARAAGA